MERVMKVPEAADYLRQSVYTIRNWIKSGKLKASRVGRDYLITEGAIRELVSPRARVRLSVDESLRVMRSLQAEGLRVGIGPDTFQKALADLEARDADSREETRRILGGGGS
jgi:excisionase family DNA binding protein